MSSLPLHPALVHLPLGLALVMPLLALGVTLALWRGWLPGRAWHVLVGAQALLLLGGLLAMNSGSKEEERVEAVVSEARIEAHEEAGEQFVWAAGVLFVLAAGGLLLSDTHRRYAGLGMTLGSLAVLGLGLRVGHAGGELVYVHGAASAYVGAGGGGLQGEGFPLAGEKGGGEAGDRDGDD
jgi:hypothetical protein